MLRIRDTDEPYGYRIQVNMTTYLERHTFTTCHYMFRNLLGFEQDLDRGTDLKNTLEKWKYLKWDKIKYALSNLMMMDSWAAISSCQSLYSVLSLYYCIPCFSLSVLHLIVLFLYKLKFELVVLWKLYFYFFLISFLLLNFVFRWISGWHQEPIQLKLQVLFKYNSVHVSICHLFCKYQITARFE